MNDDYLWEKTGEPDPEIQQLENILGELRYQPRPLEIPSNIKIGRERSFFRDSGPRLAIAAAIAMLVVGLGAWFVMQRLQRSPAPSVAQNPSQEPVKTPANDKRDDSLIVATPTPEQERTDVPPLPRVHRPSQATNANRFRNVAAKNRQLTASEREGQAAKDQLMLALRVASAKLNLAQKKAQSPNSRDQIHNQHKIG